MSKAAKNTLTFPDSGETIELNHISVTALGIRLRRLYPKPLPPAQMVDIAPGRKQKVYNFHDPEYKEVLASWGSAITEMALGLAISLSPVKKLTKEQSKKVAEYRAAHPEMDFEGDTDFDIFLELIALSTERDVEALSNFIRESGEPDEEIVESVIAGFPDTV